jgi:hypothetical protein
MKRTWFPDHTQVGLIHRDQNSYLHSLWIGFTAPLFNLPGLLWSEVIAPFFGGLWVIAKFFFFTFVAGVTGNAIGAKEE